MTTDHLNRVVVTGLGVTTSIGESVSAYKNGLIQGLCGIGLVTVFDTTGFACQTAAQVKQNDLKAGLEPQQTKRIARCDLLGLRATQEAV